MKAQKYKQELENELCENIVFDIYSILDCIEGIGTCPPDWNYQYRGLGNYEFIVRRKKVEFISFEKELIWGFPNIILEINNRVTKEKLFEWEFLFNYTNYSRNFYKKLKKTKKVTKEFLKEIFAKQFKEFEKTIKIILKNEYNKIYQLEDIIDKILFDPKKLEKEEIKIDYYPNDFYYLYYTLIDNEINIIGFYSIENDELTDKNIKFEKLGIYDFYNISYFLENKKTLKDWLVDYLKNEKGEE